MVVFYATADIEDAPKTYFLDVTFNNQWMNTITVVWPVKGAINTLSIPSGQSRRKLWIVSGDSAPKPLLFKLADKKYGRTIKVNGKSELQASYTDTLRPLLVDISQAGLL